MFEQYTDDLSTIDVYPNSKLFRLTYDSSVGKLRIFSKRNDLFEELRNAFSAENATAFFVKQYGYRSEPKVYAINKFGYFSSGLVWEILKWFTDQYGDLSLIAISKNCKSYLDEVLTPLKSFVKQIDVDWTISNIADDSGRNNERKNEGKPEFIFRDYQENSIKRLLTKGYGRGLIEIPTAGGKSFILANFCWNLQKRYNRNLKFLILVPNKQLVNQMHSDFIDYGYDVHNITKFTAGLKRNEAFNPDAKIIVANRQFVFKNEDKLPKIDALICDECLKRGSIIATINGNKKIETLTTDDLVLSYNEKEKIYEYKQVEKVHKNLKTSISYDYFLKIELEDNKILIVTPNHKIYTKNRGYIEA